MSPVIWPLAKTTETSEATLPTIDIALEGVIEPCDVISA
jgi:hypothetical protein